MNIVELMTYWMLKMSKLLFDDLVCDFWLLNYSFFNKIDGNVTHFMTQGHDCQDDL